MSRPKPFEISKEMVGEEENNGGHVILPIGGQKSPHWRTPNLPKGGQQ